MSECFSTCRMFLLLFFYCICKCSAILPFNLEISHNLKNCIFCICAVFFFFYFPVQFILNILWRFLFFFIFLCLLCFLMLPICFSAEVHHETKNCISFHLFHKSSFYQQKKNKRTERTQVFKEAKLPSSKTTLKVPSDVQQKELKAYSIVRMPQSTEI